MSSFRKIFFSGILWKAVFYISSFLLNVLLANYLGASESGIFFYLLNNLSILVFFLCFGVDSSINYFNANKEINATKLLSIGLYWSVGAALLIALLYPVLKNLGVITTIVGPEFILTFFLGAVLSANVSALFISDNNNKVANLVPAILNLFLIGFLVIIMMDKKAVVAPASIYSIYLSTSLIGGIILLFLFLQKKEKNQPATSSKINGKFLNYSATVFLGNIFLTLLMRSDAWLVRYLSTDADLGNYLQTTKFLQIVLTLPALASFTLFPLVARKQESDENIANKIVKLISTYLYASMIICLAVAIIGSWFFPLLYGASFSKMYITFLCFVPGAIALAASYPLTPYFAAKNKNNVIILHAVIAIVIMFGLDWILIPQLSIYGAAIGSSVAYSYYFISLLYKFQKELSVSIKDVFNYNKFYNELLLIFQLRSGK